MPKAQSLHYLVFKTEIAPLSKQHRQFESHFGASRFAYNCLLSWTIEEYAKHKADPSHPAPSLTQQSLQKTWTQILGPQYAPWRGENSCDPYRHAAASLAKAYRNYFHKSGGTQLPRFKRRSHSKSYTVGRPALLQRGNVVRGPAIGLVRLRERLKVADWLQRMGAVLQDATFSADTTGRVYVSLKYAVSDALALAFFRGKLHRKSHGFVGVDLGLKQYATCSDTTVVANPRYYKKLEAKLARAQRNLANKKTAARKARRQAKGDNTDRGNDSVSHSHAKARVASINHRIRNMRTEFLRQAVRNLVAQNSVVVIEDLNVASMKAQLGKSVSDASPAEFRRILTYMGERYGTQVIVADRYFPSSKTCSSCGTVKAKLSLSERQYDCSECGLSLDRDFNAALNLEKWGRDYLTQQLPFGETAAAGHAEAINGRGPEDLIVSDQSQHKAASSKSKTASASHGSLVAQEQRRPTLVSLPV